MNDEACLFCNGLEKKYKPGPGKFFICSQCVQLLLSADQADLKIAHRKAIEKGYNNQVRAIESFLIPEEISVRETKKPKRRTIRKSPMRLVRPTYDKLRTQPPAI
jgi:hypothetical protein